MGLGHERGHALPLAATGGADALGLADVDLSQDLAGRDAADPGHLQQERVCVHATHGGLRHRLEHGHIARYYLVYDFRPLSQDLRPALIGAFEVVEQSFRSPTHLCPLSLSQALRGLCEDRHARADCGTFEPHLRVLGAPRAHRPISRSTAWEAPPDKECIRMY